MDTPRCAGTRMDGQVCTAPVFAAGASFCFAHDPERAAERAEARRQGGLRRSAAHRAERRMTPRLRRVVGRLEAAMDAVEQGTMDARTGTALATIARALIAAYTAGELEERVRVLEGMRDT
jgi:hypothetical protein